MITDNYGTIMSKRRGRIFSVHKSLNSVTERQTDKGVQVIQVSNKPN